MDIHKNARLTFIRREQLARQILFQQVTVNAAAAAFNVTSRTAAKWARRLRQEGPTGLQDRSSRPHRSPRRTPQDLVQRVEQLRRQRFTGFYIPQATDLTRATVTPILPPLALNPIRYLDP